MLNLQCCWLCHSSFSLSYLGLIETILRSRRYFFPGHYFALSLPDLILSLLWHRRCTLVALPTKDSLGVAARHGKCEIFVVLNQTEMNSSCSWGNLVHLWCSQLKVLSFVVQQWDHISVSDWINSIQNLRFFASLFLPLLSFNIFEDVLQSRRFSSLPKLLRRDHQVP